jgi:GT2 family glycosyltransferase
MDDEAAVPAGEPSPHDTLPPTEPDSFDDQLDDWNLDAPSQSEVRRDAVDDDRPEDVRTTEWFSLEEEAHEEDDAPPALPRRNHHVTAVVVSHDGSVWLPAVLTTLASQSRPIDAGIGVDTGSVDGSEGLLTESFGPDRTLVVGHKTGFGDAVREGLGVLERPEHEPFTPEFLEWVWLLHDDSAPNSRCLENLLNTADDNPSAAVLGPKILGWHDRRLLLEAGVTVTGSGRRVTNLDKREHDQGQKDGVRDVLAVSSAGMLVRREVWDRLDGFNPALPLFRDDMDFCWRAHRAGERVLIATDAVIHHREASAHGRRADDLAPRPHRADREAAVHVLLAQSSALAGPFVALRLFLGALVRAAVYLLGKDVAAARDEVGGVLSVALHPSRLRASRARINRTATEPASAVRPLRASTAQQVGQALEAVGGVLTTSGAGEGTGSVSALDSGPVGDDADFMDDGSAGFLRRMLLRPSVLMVLALVAIAVIGTRGLWLGDGVIQGGALLPAPPGAGDLSEAYRQAWHDVGPGSTVPAPPYLMAIAATAFFLLGKAPLAVTLLLLLGIPIAGWSAFYALRGLVSSTWFRVWAGLAYAMLPAMTGAVASGRIGTTMVAIVLPFVIRSLVRIWQSQGTVRRSAGTALLVAIVLSVAPSLWIVLVAGAILALVWRWRSKGDVDRNVLARLAIALLVPILLLLPWTIYLFTHPVLLLLEPGISSPTITDPGLKPWDVLLLHPGGPGMVPLWVTIGIVIAGFVAFLRRDRLHVIVPIGVLGGLALLMGLLQTMFLVTPPSSTVMVRPWPGQATLLLGLAMIAAAAIAVDGLRARMAGSSFTLGQPLAAVVGVLAILAPVATAGFYAVGLQQAISKSPASQVPAFVAADSESAQAPRTLVIDDDSAGRVRYSLLTGPGPLLGDAETSPPQEVWAQIDPYVAAMASGRGGDEMAALAGYGIRYVVLSPGSSRELIPTLDGEPGLRRLSSSKGEVLWRVAGTTSRARVVEGDKQTPIGLAPDGTVTADPYIAQAMPDGEGERVLVTGAQQDGGWQAYSTDAQGNRQDLGGVAGPGVMEWAQGFSVPGGTPKVTVSYDGRSRSLWMWFELIVLFVLVVLALPERRRLDPDPDIDDPEPEAFESTTVAGSAADNGEAVESTSAEDEVVHRDDVDAEIAEMDAAAAEAADASSAASSTASSDNGPDGPSTREV